MNYRANPFQDYELITIDEGRLCLTQPAGYPRFEYQSKNIHDKIMMKVNSVLLEERRHFPLKCRLNYGNVTAFEGKLNLTRNSISGE